MGLHAAVIAGLLLVKDAAPELPPPPEAIMVSLVEAPVPQLAKADEPTPEVPPPQPPVEQPPPPEPETKPDPTPDPTPTVEPDPEPEPVIEKPPEPAKPKPKPKPKPQPKPQPVKPKPVETPPPPAPPPPPPAGTPQGSSTPQAPRQGPPQDQPELVSGVAYDGPGPRPEYPLASKYRREEGRVVLLVVISPQGNVEKLSVDSSSGYSRLDQAAMDAFRRVHFKPYTRNGVALAAKVKIPFDFNLRN